MLVKSIIRTTRKSNKEEKPLLINHHLTIPRQENSVSHHCGFDLEELLHMSSINIQYNCMMCLTKTNKQQTNKQQQNIQNRHCVISRYAHTNFNHKNTDDAIYYFDFHSQHSLYTKASF